MLLRCGRSILRPTSTTLTIIGRRSLAVRAPRLAMPCRWARSNGWNSANDCGRAYRLLWMAQFHSSHAHGRYAAYAASDLLDSSAHTHASDRPDDLAEPGRRDGRMRAWFRQRITPCQICDQAVRTAAAWASPSSLMLCSRMTNFWVLPLTVIGNVSTNFT